MNFGSNFGILVAIFEFSAIAFEEQQENPIDLKKKTVKHNYWEKIPKLSRCRN